MWTDAFAQAQGGGPAPNTMAQLLVQLGYFIPILVIIYFLMIRPQRQRQKQLDQMISTLKKGDRVLTSGGIFGTVVGVDDRKAVLKIADEVKVEFSKSSIVQVLAGESK
jgi:preprotein translocase subunit YajC